MKTGKFIVALAFVALFATFSTENSNTYAKKKEAAPIDTIKVQVDPLIIDLTAFAGRELTGERTFVSLVNGEFSGRIPTVAGMVAIGVTTSSNAIVFDRVKVTPSAPHYGKKGKNYSFSMTARGATFFNRDTNSSWRIYITVEKDGFANVSIESDEIGRMNRGNRTWRFDGQVNQGRTEAAQLLLDSANKKAAEQ